MSADPEHNVDPAVAKGFGQEWTAFQQREDEISQEEREAIFQGYFRIFPWAQLPPLASGIDVGCGSGRWAALVAPRVTRLHALDASAEALAVARKNLARFDNVTFHLASAGAIPLPDHSLEFGYSLGVLHHVPDTEQALREVARVLKAGAPFLVYLYYALDNRPAWYRWTWRASDSVRRMISRLPHPARYVLSQLIAAIIYWPLARASSLVEKMRGRVAAIPLAWYRDKTFYVMRTDAYDRFCTRLEKRFTRAEIAAMLARAGFRNVQFSETEPYWCAIGFKA
jgi:ubiquinone/menaquinone biosynthesis C-methylase UbiE